MPLLNAPLRTQLQKIADAIATVEDLTSDVPEIGDLHDTLFVDIPKWKRELRSELRSVRDAIDAQTPELQGIPGLREAVIEAIQLLKPPGGALPGVGDVDP